jgi:hypothetical protein
MEAVQTFETLVNSYQPTWRYNPENSHLQHKTEILMQAASIYKNITSTSQNQNSSSSSSNKNNKNNL